MGLGGAPCKKIGFEVWPSQKIKEKGGSHEIHEIFKYNFEMA